MKIINFLLAVIAVVLVLMLGVPLYLIGLFTVKIHSVYHFKIAISADQFGNVIGGPLFNLILKKRGGYIFGDPDDTISMCLAINYKINNLTYLGRFFADMLEFIDKGHLEKSIEKCKHYGTTD